MNGGLVIFFKWGLSLLMLLAGTLLVRRLTVGKIAPLWQSLLWLPLLLRLLYPVAGPFEISMDMRRFSSFWKVIADGEVWLRRALRIDPMQGENLFIWFLLLAAAGVMVFAAVFGISRLIFALRLLRSRKRREEPDYRLRVFVSDTVETPCLVGLFRPAVYLPTAVAEDETKRHYALTHEWVHYRHGDHIRALLRTVLLIINWYNPLMWAAVLRMKRDTEAACDAGVIRLLGEEKRQEYAATLLELTVRRRGTAIFVNGMSDRAAALRQRLQRLVAPCHKRGLAVIASALIFVLLLGCLFVPVGAKTGDIVFENSGSAEEVAKRYAELYGERMLARGPLDGGALDYEVLSCQVIKARQDGMMLHWEYRYRRLSYGALLAGGTMIGEGENEGWEYNTWEAVLLKEGDLWVEDSYGHALTF